MPRGEQRPGHVGAQKPRTPDQNRAHFSLYAKATARGHTVAKLLLEAPERPTEEAKFLDAHHVPTRYPDAFAEGIPAEHRMRRRSAVLDFVPAQMAEPE